MKPGRREKPLKQRVQGAQPQTVRMLMKGLVCVNFSFEHDLEKNP
jgi:hypothetical protein